MNTMDRFISKVSKSPEPLGCWEWNGAHFKTGYGAFYADGKMQRAHRFIYEAIFGPQPPEVMVLHVCDNRRCVRPTHLYPGTHAQNMQDRDDRHRTASGDRNGARTRPDRNAVRLYPERVARGERANKSDITADDVRTIRRLAVEGVRQVELARRYGVSQPAISKIVRREHWPHIE